MSSDSQDQSGQPTKLDLDAIEERLFYKTTKRITAYLRLRYLWMPAVGVAVFLVLSYFGASNWIAFRVQQEIAQTIDEELANGRIRIDSLVKEAELRVDEHSEAVRFYNEQMNIILRSYELLLPYVATSTESMDTTGHIVNAFVNAYSDLKRREGFRLTLSQLGGTFRFSVKVVNLDSLWLSYEIPASSVRDHYEALQEVGWLAGFPPPEVHPSLVLRAEAFFRNPRKAASDLDKIANILFGIDKVIMSKFEFYKSSDF